MSVQKNRSSPPEALRKPNKQHEAWILRRIWDRLNERNEHFMGCIVGREGSGKSFTALRIASEIDPDFSADNVIFDVEELLKILRDGDHSPGDVYVLDEAGVSLGRRTWQDRGQVLANQALQLIRSHNLGLIFTLPRLSELDSQTQGRLQAFYEIIDKEDDEYVSGKWKWFDPDRTDTTGTVYKKFPRRIVNGVQLRVTDLRFAPPPAEIVEPYEERKGEFQERVYDETLAELGEGGGDDEEENTSDPEEIASDILDQNAIEDYIFPINGGAQEVLDKEAIAQDYQIGTTRAARVKKMLLAEVDRDVM